MDGNNIVNQLPYLHIVENTNAGQRFRYGSENIGYIKGENHGVNGAKTYPTVEIRNYTGKACILASCITADWPHRPHPHRLVSKDNDQRCKKGLFRESFEAGQQLRCTLNNVGIESVKKEGIHESLRERKQSQVDPYNTNFDPDEKYAFNISKLRLCFQAFIWINNTWKKLPPVVTNIVYTYKLNIVKLSSCVSGVNGGKRIMMVCENILKNDEIRFFEENDAKEIIWQEKATYSDADIYRKIVATFETPPYPRPEGSQRVFIQLVRPSEELMSTPLQFEYVPEDCYLKQKLHTYELIINNLREELQKKDMLLLHSNTNACTHEATVPLPEFNYINQTATQQQQQQQNLQFTPNYSGLSVYLSETESMEAQTASDLINMDTDLLEIPNANSAINFFSPA